MANRDTVNGLAALRWFKSSHSGPEGGNCVEVAVAPSAVHVRDSKDRCGGEIRFRADDWAAFVSFAQNL